MKNSNLKEDYLLIINENVLKKDLKEINAIEKLFMFFISEQDDVENGKSAKLLYEKLGWNQGARYDVINSFWTTFSYAMRLKYPDKYPKAEAGNVKIYKHHRYGYYSFPEKYFKKNSEERGQVNDLCEKYPDILKLADMCHTVANFMPCPKGFGFNSVKGLLDDVRDYFPLMIDKIQRCVDDGKDLEYYLGNGNLQKIDNKIIKDWHSFFIKNQEKYCLSMYYQVNKNRINGIMFFKRQSLDYPCPQKKEEVEECLRNILDKINERADLILKKYNEEHKSNS